jgi:hypothetical protein
MMSAAYSNTSRRPLVIIYFETTAMLIHLTQQIASSSIQINAKIFPGHLVKTGVP